MLELFVALLVFYTWYVIVNSYINLSNILLSREQLEG